MNFVIVGGGSWGTAFARVLQNREHDVTLACRDPEQARVDRRDGPEPALPPSLQHPRRQGDDDRGSSACGSRGDRSRRAERRLRRGRRVARRRRAGSVADERARPGDGRPALDARAGAAGRGAHGPEHRRRDLSRPPGRSGDRERGRAARARPAGGDHLDHVPGLRQRRPRRRGVVRGREERDRTRCRAAQTASSSATTPRRRSSRAASPRWPASPRPQAASRGRSPVLRGWATSSSPAGRSPAATAGRAS